MAIVLTQVGEEWLVDKINETVQTQGEYIAGGTGAGTAVKGSTVLFTEVGETRATGVLSQPAADKIQWLGTQTYTGTKTITNAGNFTASTSGTLIVHGDFTGIGVNNNDKIEYTVQLEIT